MKYGSYIASGFKYGLISTPSNLPDGIRRPLHEAMREYNNLNVVPKKDLELDAPIYPEMLVPFESVDGLSLEDLSHYSLIHAANEIGNKQLNRFLTIVEEYEYESILMKLGENECCSFIKENFIV